MKLKPNVKLQGIRPELLVGMMVAVSVFDIHGYDMVVTSVTDGKHSRASLHYVGQAFDVRLPGENGRKVSDEIRESLIDDFDVVLESDHIHIEYQPKG